VFDINDFDETIPGPWEWDQGQQMMQTASDPFLGYTRCGGRDYLVRQLADHKAGIAPTELKGRTLVAYARLCGEVLAKGHARTSDAAMLAGYVGASHKLDRAIAVFAVAYAEQTRTDYKLFVRSQRQRHGSSVERTAVSIRDPIIRPALIGTRVVPKDRGYWRR
jgi:hypothetical protein